MAEHWRTVTRHPSQRYAEGELARLAGLQVRALSTGHHAAIATSELIELGVAAHRRLRVSPRRRRGSWRVEQER